MRVWDTEGRLLVTPVTVNISDVFDDRYIRKDASTTVSAGVIITFADSDANIRIKNGKLQVKAADGFWYYVNLAAFQGQLDLQPSATGE